MKKKLFIILSFVFLSFSVFAQDAQGRASNPGYQKPKFIPKRTVAGTLAVLDMLDYLGVEVAALPNTDYKIDPKFEKKPRIGLPMTPDMERIKLAKPDFFITVASLKAALEPQVKTAKIPTVFLKTDNYTNYLKAMEFLGSVYKKEAKAKEYADAINARLTKAMEMSKKSAKPKVLIIFGTPGSMNFATENSFVGSLVKVLGGENIWTDKTTRGPYMPINLELIKAANPDIILRFSHVNPGESSKMFKKEFENSYWSKLPAVKKGKVYDLSSDHFSVSGNIHIPEALDTLTEIFYGK